MDSILTAFTRLRAPCLAAAAALTLAACEPAMMAGSSTGPTIAPGAPVPVALLVPGGSGGDGAVSRSLENAARLAMADLDGVEIDLSVYTTGGTAGGGNAAARQAVEDGAKVILGPLYAQSANGAGLAAAASGVNVLAFSNNTAIAGGNVFVLGTTFENVADRVARFAAAQGRRNVLVVHAESTAEEFGRDAIVSALQDSRASVAGVIGFPLTEAGVRAAAGQAVATARATGADAAFFTSDYAGALGFLPQYLSEAGFAATEAQVLALARLDQTGGSAIPDGLEGAWFALPDPAQSVPFRQRYTEAYGSSPHPLATLSYDGIAAIGALVAQGRPDALSRSALTTNAGFVGVGGIFRLRPDGTNQRGLAVAQIRDGNVSIIDPAPRRFGAAGS